MKTTHTPGPWRAAPQPGQTVGVHTYTHMVMCGDDCIASLLTEPDARLIAAAPDLLAALEAFVESYSKTGEFNAHTSEYSPQQLRKLALAAIAKAKGGGA